MIFAHATIFLENLQLLSHSQLCHCRKICFSLLIFTHTPRNLWKPIDRVSNIFCPSTAEKYKNLYVHCFYMYLDERNEEKNHWIDSHKCLFIRLHVQKVDSPIENFKARCFKKSLQNILFVFIIKYRLSVFTK